MLRSDIGELHFITHYGNLPSIRQGGIHCHTTMQRYPHISIASESVQDLRAGVTVPGGMRLHDYANVYFHARNPMMYVVRKVRHVREIVVLRIDARAMDAVGVVVTDGNAASGTTSFYDPHSELHLLDKDLIVARSWNHADPFEKAERKRVRCAEILIPSAVPPGLILGCYAETSQTAGECSKLVADWQVEVNPDVFFC